jgi:hypothetical protein
MKRVRLGDWPTVRATVNPRTLEALEQMAEERALPLSALVREALDRAVRPEVFALGSSTLADNKLKTVRS